MKPIQRNEILPLGEYETIREPFRQRVVAEKTPRRIHLGDHITVVFENRDSVLLQIQEMLRTERITSEPAIQHEIETYNELVPGDRQVSITLFVEVPDREKREKMLTELDGLEDAVFFSVNGVEYPFHGKREGAQPGRTTAVHYLKCDLPADAVAKIVERQAALGLAVRHPRYEARAELQPPTLQSIAYDFV